MSQARSPITALALAVTVAGTAACRGPAPSDGAAAPLARAATAGAFLQSAGADGLVSIEAESFSAKVAQGGRDWTPVAVSGASGGALQVTPNNGGNLNTGYTTGSPRLDFLVAFVKTGTHFIWTRGQGPTPADDSYHAGLDGQALASCDRIGSFTTSWTWRKLDLDGGNANFNVATAAEHTVNAWMREDGFIIDKIVITTSASFVPTGTGPPESPRATPSNLPPTVAITAPANGATFTAPASFPVTASASDPDGTVARVELARNGVLVAADTTAPYAWSLADLPAGTHQLVATAFDAAGATATAQIAVTVTAGPAGTLFVQDDGPDGLVSIEAENFSAKVAQGGRDWTPVPQSGSSGGALQVTPNNGGNVNTGYTTASPRLDFRVHFFRTGTHYLWTRGKGATTADDSYHAGLDGQPTPTADRLGNFGTNWTWSRSDLDGGQAHLAVATAGEHTVNAWMREDGFVIDKIVITTNPFYVPAGTGPPESPRTGGNLPPFASAGPGRFSLVNRPVSLDARQSRDPDGAPGAALSFAWTQLAGPTVALSGATTATPGFTPTAAALYRFQVTVSDGAASDTDSVSVSVAAPEPGPANLGTAYIYHDARRFRFADFPAALHDQDPATLGLANYLDEPVAITLLFPAPITVVGAGGVFHSDGNWILEAASNQADLEARTGSFRVIVASHPHNPDAWVRTTFPAATFAAFRFIDRRTGGDGFVHIQELELTLANKYDGVPFTQPRGLAIDGGNRRLVADPPTGRIYVFNPDGSAAGEFGRGLLGAPFDLAIDPYENILVADHGSSRIVKFDRGGWFLGEVAATGTAAGQVSQPAGIAVDDQGRILVSELGTHRVQRLLPTGAPDATFSGDGVLGTGAAVRTNAGFDQPTDVAWDPARRELIVADKGVNGRAGNNRIQVFSEAGAHLRTISAVYDPQSVAVDAEGTIYATGGVTPVNATMGALRIARPGDEFVRDYYRNGLAGLGQSGAGLSWDSDGKLWFTDRGKRLLQSFEPGKQGDLADVTTRSGPTWIEISYRTHVPAPTVVQWGLGKLQARIENPAPTRNHVLRVNGLAPSTRYVMAPMYPRSMDGALALGRLEPVGTEPAQPGRMNVMRLATVGIIYTFGMTAERIQDLRDAFRWQEEFYFRNSHGRLWLDMQVLEIPRALAGSELDDAGPSVATIEKDLRDAGYSNGNPVDQVVAVHTRAGGNFGGIDTILGRQAGYARYTTASPFVLIHEVNHCLDAMFDESLMPQYAYAHGLWFVDPVGLAINMGLDGSVNGVIPRAMSPANILGLGPVYGRLVAVADADGDGLSEDPALPVNEASAGSNPNDADSDDDGVGDLQEVERGIFHGSRPLAADSDGDAATQGNDLRDRNPLLALNGYVARATPVVDGTFSPGEGWTMVMDRVNFQNSFSPHSMASVRDLQQHPDTRIWSAWDSQAVYFAAEYTRRSGIPGVIDRLHLRVDLNGDGFYRGVDNHHLELDESPGGAAARVHAMTQDISNIVGGGEWAEVYDHTGEWRNADQMYLTPLVDPAAVIVRVRALGGERYFAEVRIPAGARRSFQPASGKVLNFIAFHQVENDKYDLLMELDTGARLMFVDPIDSDGDGVWDQQELDIGRDPADPAR